MAKHRVLNICIPIWLAGIAFLPNASGEYSITDLFFSVTWIALPLFLALRADFFHPLTSTTRKFALYSLLLFFLIAGSSCFYSIRQAVSTQYWILTILGFLQCMSVWRIVRGREDKMLSTFAILGTIGFTISFVAQYGGHERFNSIRNPNGIGLMLVSIIASSLAIRNILLRVICVSTCFYILWHTISRASMIASIIVLLCYIAFRWKHLSIPLKVLCLLFLFILFFLTFKYQDIGISNADEFISTSFQLNDRSRGLNSGFTGRLPLWQLTFEAWQQNWLMGIGFRAHEYYPGLEISSHNGYLALLLEVGVLGAAPMAIFFISGICELFRQARQGSEVAMVGISLVSGYLFISWFEPFLINFGNPTSILVLIFLLIPMQSVRSPVTSTSSKHASPLGKHGSHDMQ